jgi:large subunit ribosomal protein L22
VRSALENANYLSTEKGLDVDVDNLYVLRAVANDGPRMKRIRPAPMGRAYRYQRRMAHIEVALAERRRAGEESAATVVGEEEEQKAPAKAAKGKTAGKPRKKPAARKAAAKSNKKSGKAKA